MDKIKKIAVVGGAGYIGSFTGHALKDREYEIVIIDNLSSGHKETSNNSRLIEVDVVTQKDVLDELFQKEEFDAVIHFAALIQVKESMENPSLYFENNVLGSLNLIEASAKNKIKAFVFSSTAAVYGNPQVVPITESHSISPTNVYGETKAMVEKILRWYWNIFRFSSVSIRYFNAAGAALDGSIGEDHPKETHLTPILIKSALQGSEMTIFGDDYDTPDGTCIRDYIHVLDLADIHIKALGYLWGTPGCFAFNAGTGKGYSNLEVLKMVEKVSGQNIKYKIGEKRDGDPAQLVADSSNAQKVLGWKPSHSNLETIVKTACLWHKKHPRGFY